MRTTGVIWSPLLPTERRGMVIRDLFDITDWLPTFLEVAGECRMIFILVNIFQLNCFFGNEYKEETPYLWAQLME